MKILQLTPGTGSFFCGSCLRDNTLAVALARAGHDAQIHPLYLPFQLEREEELADAPVHMGGINMYLQQIAPWLPRLPASLERRLDSPRLLRWASRRSGMTDPSGLGAMTLSMLRGEEGRQAHELEKLIEWVLELERPDVILLSNAMLIGMARRLCEALERPVLCTLQGEAPFLDALPEDFRAACWETLAERARHVQRFIAVSRYTGDLMAERLRIEAERLHVVPNGIELADFAPALDSALSAAALAEQAAGASHAPPTIGYLARLCRDKGLPELVDAYLRVRAGGRVPGVRLVAGGVELAEDRALVRELRERVRAAGAEAEVEFRPNLSRAQKIALLQSLSVFSVPARYGESFGLYLLEALACALPVVQPRLHGFTELVEHTGGGILYAPEAEHGLADALESLLLDPARSRALGAAGRASVQQHYNADRMAREVALVCARAVDAGRGGTEPRSSPPHSHPRR